MSHGTLTFPQRAALAVLLNATGPLDARRVARRDVLWRLQGKGYVRENFNGQWSITGAGAIAYDSWWEANS